VQWVTRSYGLSAAEALYDELNLLHFECGKKLNDRRMLVQAAANAGADAAAAESFLASDEGGEEIHAAGLILSQLGISSIPTFILGASRVVGGALHAEELVTHLRELEAQPEGAPNTLFGEALGIPPSILNQTLDLDRYANAAWASA